MTYGPVVPRTTLRVTERFDCGSAAQTLWLRRHALQAHRTDSSRVRVVTHEGDHDVAGSHQGNAGDCAFTGTHPRIIEAAQRPLHCRAPTKSTL